MRRLLAPFLDRPARGAALLADDRERPIQPVDVRDLAAFVVHLVEHHSTGATNVVAPAGHARYGDLIEACVTATGAGTEPVWVEPGWLTGRGVKEWTELPLWRTAPGTWLVDGTRARHLGLSCRPLDETVADTWAWLQREAPVPHPRAAEHGLAPTREANLLREWSAELASRSR